jgi:hypothetical protein
MAGDIELAPVAAEVVRVLRHPRHGPAHLLRHFHDRAAVLQRVHEVERYVVRAGFHQHLRLPRARRGAAGSPGPAVDVHHDRPFALGVRAIEIEALVLRRPIGDALGVVLLACGGACEARA